MTDTDKQPLLNIKQAAEILNASEISLRRWTDAGKLACLRIGGKRERRFRREDLIAFLEQQNQPNLSNADQPKGKTDKALTNRLYSELGHHLTAVYDHDLGRIKHSVPFLAEGIRVEDNCLIIATGEVTTEILTGLREANVDVDAALLSEKLIVLEGESSPSKALEQIEGLFIKAMNKGASFFRIVGDMAWVHTFNWHDKDIMKLESGLHQLIGKRYPAIGICQYDSRLFSGRAIHTTLKNHDNTFNQPLAQFL